MTDNELVDRIVEACASDSDLVFDETDMIHYSLRLPCAYPFNARHLLAYGERKDTPRTLLYAVELSKPGIDHLRAVFPRFRAVAIERNLMLIIQGIE